LEQIPCEKGEIKFDYFFRGVLPLVTSYIWLWYRVFQFVGRPSHCNSFLSN